MLMSSHLIPSRQKISQYLHKHLGFVIALTVIVVLIALGFMPRPLIVDMAEVRRGTLQELVEEEGKARVKDRFVVSAPVDGFLQRIQLHVGDTIYKDQPVAQLEPLRPAVLDSRSRAEAQARVSAAQAKLEASEKAVTAAKADAEYASAELQRLEELSNKQSISIQQLQQGRANAKRTQANLQSAEFAVDVARFELAAATTALEFSAAGKYEGADKVSILAPVDGHVLRIYRESEGVVTAGQPVLELGDPHSLEVEIDVLSADAARIRVGTKVLFDRWGGEVVLQGRVRVVEPVAFTKVSALGVEEQRVLVIADITSPLDLWKTLGDGYRVEAQFILWDADDVLQIPTNTLFRQGQRWAVFVVNNGRASIRQVTLGKRSGVSAQVLDGLTENELVVVHPSDSLQDSSRVQRR